MSMPAEQMDQVLALMMDEEENTEGEGPLSDDDILSIVAAEMSQSSSYDTELEGNREESLDYYLGNPRGDEQEGRSQIVSTDVADAIEWILPQIIKSLVSKGSVVQFDPMSEEDEEQAELETEFTHDTFMKENEGLLNLYEFVKDALMQKNGIFKTYYDESEKIESAQYDGLTRQELEMVLQQPEVELIEYSEEVDPIAMQQREQSLQQMQAMGQQLMQQAQQSQEPQQAVQAQQQMQQLAQQVQQVQQMPPEVIISAVLEVTTIHGKVRIDCVPPEQFRINSDHDSLSLDDARFTAHVRNRTKSELIEDGYDPEIIMAADSNLSDQYGTEQRFNAQGEETQTNYSEDESQQLLEVSECCMMIDLDRTGRAQRMNVTVLGSDEPTDVLLVEPMMESPFTSASCIIMAHKFYGLSVHDRLKQLQDQKTSLWRNILDNLYLQNNREKEVVEGQVNLDDLLISRPGGIKRVKQPGMIRELQVQPVGQEGYQMLDYLDQVRTGRVGVSPDTAGQIDAIGTAVGSEGVAKLMTAKEELVGLMVRVVAEQLKQTYVKIRDNLVRYQDGCVPFKFKGEWANVNPSEWGDRSRTTVKVGTGTGDDTQKVGAIQQVIAYQAQALQHPANTMVDQPQIYEAMDEFCRVSGLSSASPYFLDPRGKEGQQKSQQKDQQQQQEQQKKDQLEQLMANAQAELGKAEVMKGQAALQSQQAKVQVEQGKLQMDSYKQQAESEKDMLQLQLQEAQTQLKAMADGQKLAFDYEKLEQEEALKLTELELTNQREISAQHEANKAGSQDNG